MPTTKICFACKIEKPVSEFYRSNKRYFQRECKDCTRERKYRWHQTEDGKLSSANTKLKRRFGISLTDFNALLAKQNFECRICASKHSANGHRLAVDHCHKTGKIRGLLCKACNVALGNLRDNSELCVKAARYLEGLQ